MALRDDSCEGAMAASPSASQTAAILSSPAAKEDSTTANLLDDVFSTTTATTSSSSSSDNATHPSDMPRLRSTHHSTGYLNGLTDTKPQHLQSGFDMAFPLGAQFGLRIGYLLGILEGLHRHQDLQTAEHDLDVARVFGEECWGGEDGLWRFDVEAGEEGGEVGFEDVVKGHPAVGRWGGRVERVAGEAGVDLRVLEERDVVEEEDGGFVNTGDKD
jgi:hypothetical protein